MMLLSIEGETGENRLLHAALASMPYGFSVWDDELRLIVFNEAGLPNDTALARAWAGALTLIALVILLNVVARLLVRRSKLQPS